MPTIKKSTFDEAMRILTYFDNAAKYDDQDDNPDGWDDACMLDSCRYLLRQIKKDVNAKNQGLDN
ncbi:hypothetical protein BKE30_03845 [Alkanindiges hydrocarboniclasticus]|uniref:Uncharacterized protein n=1 Tax=Alkanindiges hydrocarboniclasticus TaxID=1907941 RepID=A0A1S8CX23_9GAMM|nr:hypothetical protein [Alkanindiges hydrocarboniclasticus]ONG41574.1 hypothetical protein BKE30_03845 [Alkanindiges hydrocarboniclasticus]